MKFITPRFQAKCAKLALSQISKPSSAPSDTRLFLRLDSASNPRPSSVSVLECDPVLSSTKNVRPVTAPLTRQSTQNVDDNGSKPSIKTEAFTRSNSDAAQLKSLSFKSTQFVGIGDQGDTPKLEKERTRLLSSVSEPGSQHRPDIGQIKLMREQTFFEQVSVPHNEEAGKSGIMKTVKQTRDEKELEQKGKIHEKVVTLEAEGKTGQKMNKNEQKMSYKAPSRKQDSVNIDDKTSFMRRDVEEERDLKHTSDKTNTGQCKSRQPEKEEMKRKTMSIAEKEIDVGSQHGKDQDEVETNVAPITEASNGAGIRVLNSSKNAGKNVKSYTEKESDNVDIGTVSDIQLMSGNKPGNMKTVRTVGIEESSVKKRKGHTGGTTGNRTASNNTGGKKTANTKDTAFTILRNLTGQRGHGTYKPGQVPNVSKPVRKYKFDKPSGPSSSQIIKAIIDDKQSSVNRQNQGSRPVVDKEIPAAASAQSSGKNRVNCVDSANKSLRTDVITIPFSATQQKLTKSATKSTSGKFPKDYKGDKSGMAGSRGQDSITEVKKKLFTRGPAQTKGVRLQNGLIATKMVESNEFNERNEMDSYPDIPHLHPKFKESPYLKDNPLLMSGKLRLQGSASSFGRSKDTNQ